MAATVLFLILLIVAVLILALLLALYLVPVTVSTVADCSRESARATATVAWGIVGGRVRVGDGVGVLEVLLAGRPVVTRDLEGIAAAGPSEEAKEREEQGSGLSISEYIEAAGDLWPHLRGILEAVYRSLYLETLRGNVTLGLDSPADTGAIYGYCTAARYALWPVEAVDFVMTPVFNERIFAGTFTLKMQIRRPLLILVAIARALWQKPVRQRLRQLSGRGAPGA